MGVKGEAGSEKRFWKSSDGFRKKHKAEAAADRKLKKMAESAEPGRCYTLDEIASQMGVTRERVRQIQQRALHKLHKRFTQIFKTEDGTPGQVMSVFGGGSSGHEHDIAKGDDNG